MPAPVPQQRAVPAAETAETADGADLTLLVIQDDPTGTFSLPDLPAAAGARVRVRTARNLTEAGRLLTDDVDCILLDLSLPDGSRRTLPRPAGWPTSRCPP